VTTPGLAKRSDSKVWLLVLLLLLFILPLAVGTYWMYFQSKQEIERAELQSDQLRARTLSAIVEESFTSAENLLTSIANRSMLRLAWAHRDVDALTAHLDEARKLDPSFLFVSAYELNGTMRAIVPPDKIVGQNFAYRDWYRGVSANWQPYVSEVYRTAAASSPLVVAVAVPLRDERGVPTGILMATYSLSQLASEFSVLEKGETADFYVVDQHGVIAATHALNASEPKRFSASNVAVRALAGQEGSGQFAIDGKNTFLGFAPIQRLGWAVIYARRESDALAPAVRLRVRNRSVALYLFLIYLATAALAALLMRRQTQLFATNQALIQELEKQSKFKDQFLSTMSHELRTPLNAVLGFSDLLADARYGPLNEKQLRYINHIHTGGKHLLSLISDILDLSKIEAGRMELAMENLAVQPTFAEVISVMQPLADKKSHVLSTSADAGLAVRADATRLKQVLMNLLGNAIKFTPNGGRIELAARLLEGKVRVEVRDNGPGIPPDEQKRIFEAFYRLRESGKKSEGTGLGLAITQRLVELHGGELRLESQAGQGSCFYFHLPALVSVREAPARKSDAAARSVATARILVIEDDRATAQLIHSQLTSAGYEVSLCEEPQNALEVAAQLQPRAITLDIVMKPKNGWEVLVQLKRDPRTAHIPMIVVSIVDQPSMGTLLGADDYLVKPVDKRTLLGAIARHVGTGLAVEPARPILVVEDDTPTREFIAEMLSTHSYTVATASDGAQARAQVAASLPQLVILDMMLPQVSGFELLGEWRASLRTSSLPVFVLTSKDLSQEEQRYLRTHSELLLRKQQPWHEALIKQLERVVAPRLAEKV
jgi:signal transduction histidine kinase/DNA-binding response OmpR family regulator